VKRTKKKVILRLDGARWTEPAASPASHFAAGEVAEQRQSPPAANSTGLQKPLLFRPLARGERVQTANFQFFFKSSPL